jgi:hypothetical protein
MEEGEDSFSAVCQQLIPVLLLGLITYPENGDDIFLRSDSGVLSTYTALQPGREHSSNLCLNASFEGSWGVRRPKY